ncbi:MAG: U32 family peptidase [Actinobacteria bacterium]|nr:U32 family peptidase [Actinomycetota bacterium]
MLRELALVRPHALILQDLGLVRIVREFFPELPMHASTQMGFHNSPGAEVARTLGFRRVILERQVSIQEVQQIAANTTIELEIFVHGALCSSRSGQCLLSSWMGGWSGNRGRCKQPCRRRYHSEEGNGFFFSTKDLCSIDEIPHLRNMRIASLKIEGRLKSAEYVNQVVQAYRMVLDAAPKLTAQALHEARSILSDIPSRRWTPAFKTAADFAPVIKHDSLGTSGRPCGRVTRSTGHGIFVDVTYPFRVGDTLRLQPPSGDEGPVFAPTRIMVDRRSVSKVTPGTACYIPCDKEVPSRCTVYRTGSQPIDRSARIAALPLARAALDLSVDFTHERLRINLPAVDKEWSVQVDTQKAQHHSLTAELLIDELRRTRSTLFVTANVQARVTEDLFLPARELKRLRREFWLWVEQTITPEDLSEACSAHAAAALQDLAAPSAHPTFSPQHTVAITGGTAASYKADIVAGYIDTPLAHVDEIILPDFCPEGDLPALRQRLRTLVQEGHHRFRVTSLFALHLLPVHDGAIVTTSFPLPACNRSAVGQLMALGATKVQAWVELERSAIESMTSDLQGALEVFVYGRLPLLTSRFLLAANGSISDGRGAAFTVESEGIMHNVYPGKVFQVSAPHGVSMFTDLTHCEPAAPKTSTFNYDRELV